ncbi:hypothetical protein AURDEDRAFT_158569 [Auricularia subglabra TFB-10046 SS5]|nr:hypothetical protein AURDEDRAFT_158569 [Auricularia subglabra TFB-10046 SS5]
MHKQAASLWPASDKLGSIRPREIISATLSQLHTLYLFMRSDFKTVMFPVSPQHLQGRSRLAASQPASSGYGVTSCNAISNQTTSNPSEDSANRPWRPLPSGRISQRDAVTLRWVVCAWCLVFSALRVPSDVLLTSVAFALTNYLHNELGWSDHWLKKNVCNGVAYGLFEWGTTRLAAGGRPLGGDVAASVLVSALVILTTIQMQDFADVHGDRAAGRATLPIRFPTASKVFTAAALFAWSLSLGLIWDLSPLLQVFAALSGGVVAFRALLWCDSEPRAARSYVYYNMWLMVVHTIPFVSP